MAAQKGADIRFRFIILLAAGMALAGPCEALAIAPKVQFSYTGGEQSYVVPAGVVMVGLAAEGGQGGGNGGGAGREGGVGALLTVTPGQRLFAEVGAAGVYGGGPVFGGGGAAGPPPPVVGMCNGSPCAHVYASSGGGASDVRTCSISAASCSGGVSSAATRLIVGGGGGGESGSGNGPDVQCVGNGNTGSANNFQYPPGNPSGGHPVPIITAAGIVYPANYLPDTSQSGITPAGNGTATAGFGGVEAGCSSGGSVFFSDSVAGSSAVGPVGGTGGNASSLGPMYSGCVLAANNCFDAGPGGGGGGGYFGGGGGATGLDKTTGNCGTCNGASSGLLGGGGSSFTSNWTMDPVDESNLLGAGNGLVIIVPTVEIDTPANGAVYAPGQVVNASWACAYDNASPGSDLGFGNGCSGSVANGSPIDTSPGTHTFTVTGTVSSNGNHAVSATVTYVVKAATKTVRASFGGYTFTLAGPSKTLPPGGKLTVTVTKTGSSKTHKVVSLSFFIGRGVKHVKHKSVVYTPNRVASKPGTYSFWLKGLKAGSHKLRLVIVLTTKNKHKSKTVPLTLPFSLG
jgi:hypothetical protein